MSFDLQEYLSNGIEKIIKGAMKASLSNPKESKFLARFMLTSKKALKKRKDSELNNEHIPPFLIASITSQCNLHCAGCYARGNHSCHDGEVREQLTENQWADVFTQAKDLGISFILLAGGEPLVRKDVVMEAAKFPEIIFPVFTNGTMLENEYIDEFDKHRNLIPIISIEGERETTDNRRGEGVYTAINQAMQSLSKRKILFGASVTVTKQNMDEVMSDAFLNELHEKGCKVVIYVEYVPINKLTIELAPDDEARKHMTSKLKDVRETYDDMVFISFPGDEKTSGGCLAAGRGFFHINSQGGAEPCPFSPYSDINVVTHSLVDVMHSPLFSKLREGNLLMEDHDGGCVLFNKESMVMALAKGEAI